MVMTRPLVESTFVLWILLCSVSLAQDYEKMLLQQSKVNGSLKSLNQQVDQLIEQGKYQEAIPFAERAVAVAKSARASKLDTADALNNLGVIFTNLGDYTKAEPLLLEACQIRQKVKGSKKQQTATDLTTLAASLSNLGLLYEDVGDYGKAEPLLKEALEIDQKGLGPERRETL